MSDTKEIVRESLELFRTVYEDDAFMEKIDAASRLAIDALKSYKKILVCGNGGSAADSQHLAAELVGSFLNKIRRGLAAISLTVDTSILTSVGNDISFGAIFARQVEALGNWGDVLVGISTSGNSENVRQAFEIAKIKKVHTIAITGQGGGAIGKLADVLIDVPSKCTPRIQEIHTLVIHIICQQVEAACQ